MFLSSSPSIPAPQQTRVPAGLFRERYGSVRFSALPPVHEESPPPQIISPCNFFPVPGHVRYPRSFASRNPLTSLSGPFLPCSLPFRHTPTQLAGLRRPPPVLSCHPFRTTSPPGKPAFYGQGPFKLVSRPENRFLFALWTAPPPGIRKKPENLRERSSVFSIKRSPDKTDSPARPRLPPKTAAMAKSGPDDDLQDRIGF